MDTHANAALVSISEWYERIIDWMALNPTKRLFDCAKELNVAPDWLSVIINSDSFRQAVIKRREVKGLDLIVQRAEERLGALAHITVETLAERVSYQGNTMPTEDLVDIANMAMKNIKGEPALPGTVINNTVMVDASLLAQARQQMVEGKATEVKEEALEPPKEKEIGSSSSYADDTSRSGDNVQQVPALLSI